MANNDDNRQGVDMATNWTDWRAILKTADGEAQETGKSVNEVISAHILAEIRQIRQATEDAREQQVVTWREILAGVGQILAGLRSPGRR